MPACDPATRRTSSSSASADAWSREHFVQVGTPSKFTLRPPPLTLEWSHVTLTAEVKSPQTKQVETKIILSDVNGAACPGGLLVIMGPSGAGKSSLMDCISGRKKGNSRMTGRVAVNGRAWSKSLKKITAYVMQDDLFYETITVHEHLAFQAKLRMGKRFSHTECETRVREVMEELGLAKCRDTLIGGSSLRGISGGERKRLSFATEILTNPSLLFVDEPTSGLDSFMAETVVQQLQRIAHGDGRTVIATIHQPSSELFALFDRLYLLSDGACVYEGPASDSVNYFASLGFACPAYVSPTDYFMRQLVVVDKDTDAEGVARVERFKTEWAARSDHQDSMVLPVTTGFEDSEDLHSKSSRIGVPGQLYTLLSRNVLGLVRDHIKFHAELAQSLFVGLIIGLLYLQVELDQNSVQNVTGAFYFMLLFEVMAGIEPVLASMPLQVTMVQREYDAGLFHLASWYAAHNAGDLPLQFMLPVVAFVPAYLLMSIGHTFRVFVYLQIMLVLGRSTAVGLGYMVSCACRRGDVATIFGMLLLLPMMLFGGVFIAPDSMPGYFSWINYVSPVKYTFEAMMKIFWLEVPSISCDVGEKSCVATTGAQVLVNYGVSSHSALRDALLLIVVSVGYRVLGFFALCLNVRNRK